LDEMDRLQLWDTTTVVLSSDHGMHNGEKGMWDKWTLFDESAPPPLIVHHPLPPSRASTTLLWWRQSTCSLRLWI